MSSKPRTQDHDLDHETEEQAPNPQVNRRTMLRLTGAAAGTVAAGAGAQQAGLDVSPVGEAEAIAPVVVAGGALAVGWALREYEVVGSDDPPEGLTVDALGEQIISSAQKRASTNASTFIDNQNIADSGIEHSLYADGKVSAIEALNNQESESDVESAAITEAKAQGTTVVTNFLKSWNESVNEIESFLNTSASHSDVDKLQFMTYGDDWYNGGNPPDSLESIEIVESDITLPDDSTFTVKQLKVTVDNNNNLSWARWGPTSISTGGDIPDELHKPENWGVIATDNNGNTQRYMLHSDWSSVYETLTQTVSDAMSGLVTWVGEVYGQVQSGELNTEDLLTPRELAEMSADEEGVNQAIADLMALNIPVDLEREAHINIPEYGADLVGQLAVTNDVSVSAGDTIDPSSTNEDYYFTYDVSEGSGVWTAYNSGVDGGVVTFTDEPYETTEYTIHTAAGESATVSASGFTDEGDGTYTVDVSGQLETAITEIDEVEYQPESDKTQYETIQLQNEFTVEKIENSDGEEVDSMDFTQSEPQSDSNYITEEEWQEMQDRNQELIDKYENSQNDSPMSGISGLGGNNALLALALGIPVVGFIIVAIFLAIKELHPAM